MRLRVVGCTGSMSGPGSAASCYLVQARGFDPATGSDRTWNVVMDLGPGSFGQLWTHIDPREIDAVIFSHCHADHVGDVISLHVHRRWGPARGRAPITMAGPAGLLDRVRQIDGVGAEETYEGEFTVRTLEARVPLHIGPLTLTPATAWHSVPGFGIRVEGPAEVPTAVIDDVEMPDTQVGAAGADPASGTAAQVEQVRRSSLFYTGDTDQCDTITRGASGVDLLLAEAGFTSCDEVRGIHMTGARAGDTATAAGVGRVVLTHIQPWTDPREVATDARTTWSGPLDIAHAGQEYLV
ncbi:MAG: MBL fold metallo-hydrolase [Pauljensenia sp.]